MDAGRRLHPAPQADGTGEAIAEDANADGSIIVGTVFRLGTNEMMAAIWDQTHGACTIEQMIEGLGIDLGGWRLSSASAISDNGHVIAGVGINPSGATEGWVFINPEPSTGSLLALGFVGLGARRSATRRAA